MKRRLETLVDEILELLRAAQKVKSREAAVDAMQSVVQDRADAEFILKRAKKEIRFKEIGELEPDMLYRLLGLLRTQDDRARLFDGIPQERIRIVEIQLTQIRDELLPQVGQQLMDAGKELTRKPAGRRSKMPPDEVCRAICSFIADLNSKQKVGKVDAQKRAASKWDIKFRTIERIWSRRNEFLVSDEDQTKDV